MAGDRNKTPQGRAEAIEVIREAGLRFDGQDFDKRRIDEISSNKLLPVTKLERARGKHITEHKVTMVRKEDRLGVFISEPQSKVDSGQAYESAYDSGKDPDNYLVYDSANHPASNPPASNPPSTPTSMSANRNPSTPIKQKFVSDSLHGGHNSDKSLSKERQSREARSSHSGKAHSQPISAQSASEIPRAHSSAKSHRRSESDLEICRSRRTKRSARSYSPSNF